MVNSVWETLPMWSEKRANHDWIACIFAEAYAELNAVL